MASPRQGGSRRLNTTAEAVGATLGRLAARMDALQKQRAELATDLRHLVGQAREMLNDVGPFPFRAQSAKGRAAKNKGGRPVGYVMSETTKQKLRDSWQRRRKEQLRHTPNEKTKPANTRATIRATDGRKFTARQAGRG